MFRECFYVPTGGLGRPLLFYMEESFCEMIFYVSLSLARHALHKASFLEFTSHSYAHPIKALAKREGDESNAHIRRANMIQASAHCFICARHWSFIISLTHSLHSIQSLVFGWFSSSCALWVYRHNLIWSNWFSEWKTKQTSLYTPEFMSMQDVLI